MIHLVEQWRQGAWHIVGASPDEATAIELYLATKANHPTWAIRRVTVHETTS